VQLAFTYAADAGAAPFVVRHKVQSLDIRGKRILATRGCAATFIVLWLTEARGIISGHEFG